MNENEVIKIMNNLIDNIYASSSGVGKAGLKKTLEYIEQLQQENTQLKQQLKDKDEKISRVIILLKNPSTIDYEMYGLECSRDVVNIKLLLEILESNKED